MRLLTQVVRAAFLWSIPALVGVLLWAPLTGLLSGGPLGVLLAGITGLFVLSLVRAAVAMTADLVTGRYDAARAASQGRGRVPPD